MENYKDIIGSIPDLIKVVAKDGIILEVIAHPGGLFYDQRDSLPGTRIGNVFSPDVTEEFERNIASVCGVTGRSVFEFSMNHDGIDRFYEVRLSRLKDRDEVVAIFRDRTEEIKTRQHLERLALAIDQTEDTVFITDRRGNILYANSAMLSIYGYEKDELIGQNPRILKSGIKDSEFYNELWSTIMRGNTFRAEVINKGKHGNYVYEDRNITPIKDASGFPTHFLSVGRDITERKLFEIKQSKSERRSEIILQTALDGFLMVGETGKVKEVNDAYCKMLGYTRDEMMGLYIHDLEANMDADEVAEKLELFKQIGHASFESRHRRKDGTLVDVEVRITIVDLDGTYYISFLKDITEKKKAENELKLKNFAMECSTVGIALMSLKGFITYANTSLLVMLKHTSLDNLVGTDASQMMAEEGKLKEILANLEKDGFWKGRAVLNCRTGNKLPSDMAISVVKDENGNKIYYAINVLNVEHEESGAV